MDYPNWFASTEAQANFSKYLAHQIGKPNLSFLQLGAYTGDASVWLVENILTDTTSKLIDVDTWQGSDEEAHHSMDFNEVFNIYKYKINKYKNIHYYKQTTMSYLRADTRQYEFIYIDADHTAVGVLLDAELSWDLLKSGGLLAFDDYQWNQGNGELYNPRSGIDTFIQRHRTELEIVHHGWQLWVEKK